jgi:hypothetical protein
MANGHSKKKPRGVIKYKSYAFVDKDPLLLLATSKFHESGKTFAQMVADTGGSKALYGWINKDVRRPQCATIMAHLRALGVKHIDLTDGKPTIK